MSRTWLNIGALLVLCIGTTSAFERSDSLMLNDKCSSDDGTTSCSCARKCTHTTDSCSCS